MTCSQSLAGCNSKRIESDIKPAHMALPVRISFLEQQGTQKAYHKSVLPVHKSTTTELCSTSLITTTSIHDEEQARVLEVGASY